LDIRDFKPAKQFALQYGAKIICYGPPGSGKTPILNTASNFCLLVTEPGMMSMRTSNVPAVLGRTPEEIDDFFKWLFGSAESRKFDGVAIDSASQLAETYLDRELDGKSKSGNKVDGKAAYGNMSRAVQKHLNGLFFLPQKHVYLICKQMTSESDGVNQKRPYFPGQDLNVKIPHLYDIIVQLDKHQIPSYGPQRAFRCIGDYSAVARDRSGSLAEFEPPDLGALIKKVMAT